VGALELEVLRIEVFEEIVAAAAAVVAVVVGVAFQEGTLGDMRSLQEETCVVGVDEIQLAPRNEEGHIDNFRTVVHILVEVVEDIDALEDIPVIAVLLGEVLWPIEISKFLQSCEEKKIKSAKLKYRIRRKATEISTEYF